MDCRGTPSDSSRQGSRHLRSITAIGAAVPASRAAGSRSGANWRTDAQPSRTSALWTESTRIVWRYGGCQSVGSRADDRGGGSGHHSRGLARAAGRWPRVYVAAGSTRGHGAGVLARGQGDDHATPRDDAGRSRPGTLAVIAAPEALTGFELVTADRQPGDEWRNEINTSAAFAMFR